MQQSAFVDIFFQFFSLFFISTYVGHFTNTQAKMFSNFIFLHIEYMSNSTKKHKFCNFCFQILSNLSFIFLSFYQSFYHLSCYYIFFPELLQCVGVLNYFLIFVLSQHLYENTHATIISWLFYDIGTSKNFNTTYWNMKRHITKCYVNFSMK